jgi:thioredoxin-related protein
MPLVLLLNSVLILAAPVASGAEPCAPQETRATAAQDPRGKVAWFAGSYDELLARAKSTKRIVFLDFYSRSNTYSKKLEKITYNDPRVVTELASMLCFAIDADTKESKPLRKAFQVQSPPALVFLDPDGSLRDQLSGYFGPDPFLMELRRIQANQGTFSDLRARIRANENDLDSRWQLACKLRSMGDLLGYEEQVRELRERDPEGRSLASRRLRLMALHLDAKGKLELDPLYRFVQAEQDPALLFEGWWAIWEIEGQALRAAQDPEAVRRHELRFFAAARALWPLVPEEKHGFLGNNIAWSFYENRARAAPSDLEFALSVAVKAAAAAPDVPAVVDTLACCLFAVGKREEALVEVKRCIELDPQNPEWRERLAEFQAR